MQSSYLSSQSSTQANALSAQMNPAALSRQRNTRAYIQAGQVSKVEGASPARLIQLLYERLIEHLQHCQGFIQQENLQGKITTINKSIKIIEGLHLCLDREAAPELSDNLAGLYDYMSQRLLMANLHNDIEAIGEVLTLAGELATAWGEIA